MLSLTVFLTGVMIYINQLEKIKTTYNNVNLKETIVHTPIVPMTNLDGGFKSGKRIASPISVGSSQMPNLQESGLMKLTPLDNISSGTVNSTSAFGIRKSKKGNEFASTSSSIGSDLLAFSSTSRAIPSSDVAGGGGLSSISSITETSIVTPFAAPTATNGTIIVDPMTDPDPSTRIPVGDSWWLLIVLSLIYTIFIRVKI